MSYKAMFLVTLTVTGYGSKMRLQADANVENHPSKDHTSWFAEIVQNCKDKWCYKPSFNSQTRILNGENHVHNLLEKPSEQNLKNARYYFTLLQHFLGDFRSTPGSYTSLRVQAYINDLRDKLTEQYSLKQTVDTQLVECLYDLSDLLGFSVTDECLLVENICEGSPTSFILVKDHNQWVRDNKEHMAYKRLILARKLRE